MRERARSRKAFDRCQVRAVIERPYTDAHGSMACAKYPTGLKVSYDEMSRKGPRDTFALTLGCLACPYRKSDLQPGESGMEAIERLSSQNSVDQLNRLFERQDIAEPPGPSDAI